mgnify:CR=1 FL=1
MNSNSSSDGGETAGGDGSGDEAAADGGDSGESTDGDEAFSDTVDEHNEQSVRLMKLALVGSYDNTSIISEAGVMVD